MCPPAHFDVKYAINPQMKAALERGVRVDKNRAFLQWMRLAFLLQTFGVEVRYILSPKKTPDMVFAANAGFPFNGRVAISHFRHTERRKEEPYFARFFRKQLGMRAKDVIASHAFHPEFFEGKGDVLWHEDTLVCGYGLRSTRKGIEAVLEAVGYTGKRVFLELVDERFYHLDTCLCLSGKYILWYPPAFRPEAWKVVSDLVPPGGFSIIVSEEDALEFACNGIFLENGGKKHLITRPVSPRLRGTLQDLGITVHENDVSEFLKAAGGNQCLVLFLN
ncbi:MAG: hypothetical protein HYY60_03075 [Parcubacteria group bacterium]|nr:hypothetical protein [Parcubacteria group bacterium]